MRRILVLVTLIAIIPAVAWGRSITVGDLEFNHSGPGVNNITLNNFTGSNNLGVFPVADDITFDHVVLTLTESDGTVLRFDLGSVGPGTNTSAQFSDSLLISCATLSGRLSRTKFDLRDRHPADFFAEREIEFPLCSSAGTYLIAGLDLGTIQVSEESEGCRDEDRKVGRGSQESDRRRSDCDRRKKEKLTQQE